MPRLLPGKYRSICGRGFASGTSDVGDWLSDLFDTSNKHYYVRALYARHVALQKQLATAFLQRLPEQPTSARGMASLGSFSKIFREERCEGANS